MLIRFAMMVVVVLTLTACESTVTRVEGGSKGIESWAVGVQF
jgi:hypothetical protein